MARWACDRWISAPAFTLLKSCETGADSNTHALAWRFWAGEFDIQGAAVDKLSSYPELTAARDITLLLFPPHSAHSPPAVVCWPQEEHLRCINPRRDELLKNGVIRSDRIVVCLLVICGSILNASVNRLSDLSSQLRRVAGARQSHIPGFQTRRRAAAHQARQNPAGLNQPRQLSLHRRLQRRSLMMR